MLAGRRGAPVTQEWITTYPLLIILVAPLVARQQWMSRSQLDGGGHSFRASMLVANHAGLLARYRHSRGRCSRHNEYLASSRRRTGALTGCHPARHRWAYGSFLGGKATRTRAAGRRSACRSAARVSPAAAIRRLPLNFGPSRRTERLLWKPIKWFPGAFAIACAWFLQLLAEGGKIG